MNITHAMLHDTVVDYSMPVCYVARPFVLLPSVLIYMFIAMETATEKVL